MSEDDNRRWSFGIDVLGRLNVFPHEMPPAGNLLVVDMVERDGIWTVAAADLERVRELIGTPPDRISHADDGVPGPDAVAELERMGERISGMIRQRIDEITGEDEDEPSPFVP
jgi:hypothetical protein